jgi:type IV pilus assembly protein PilB
MSTTAKDRVAFLKHTELFLSLNEEELEVIAARLNERVYPPNTVIIREGAPGDSMFIIVRGKADVKRKEPSIDIDLTIATLGAGACFGEMSLLTGRPRSATVMTPPMQEMTEVLVLKKGDFEETVRECPSIPVALNKILAVRIEEMNTQRSLGFASLSRLKLDVDVLSVLPPDLIKRHKVLPVAYSSNTLTLAMVNPNDLVALDEVRRFVRGVAIEPLVAAEDDFRRFMEGEYPRITKPKGEKQEEINSRAILQDIESTQSDILRDIQFEAEEEGEAGITDLEKEAKGAPIVRLTNNIIAVALRKGASDIHIEPLEKSVRVRFRVDGVLTEEMVLPKKVLLPLVSRIKIISKLDITERRLPQDGRITLRLQDKAVDFRVSTMPTKFGEKVVTRVLDKSNAVLGLERLFVDQATLDLVRAMIKRPHGILYVTGPTGSGKSTTLYSALSELNRKDVNISTVEDPIEYEINGINQVQVNPDIGLDFARVLRGFLRQDPDIILVGETRDTETAKIAVEAALTGHLVLTTLHANDAPSTTMRLSEMGIEPFLIAASVIGIIAQRLVRRICSECKERYDPDPAIVRYLGLSDGMALYKGRGCGLCGSTGYKGRVGVYEVLTVNDATRHLISEGSDVNVIRQEAIKWGMKTLKDYSVLLLENGLTTVDEVLRTVAIQV